MNKKSYLRTLSHCLLGVIVGIVISSLTDNFLEGNIEEISQAIQHFFLINLNYCQIALLVFLLIPSIVNLLKGKRLLKQSETASEDDIDGLESQGKRHIDIAVTLNVILLIMNFVLLGIGFTTEMELNVMLIGLGLMVVTFIAILVMEIQSISSLQKSDSRIKGDPSRFNFRKAYIESCDEAEKQRIYKAAYKSFQFTKFVGFICMLVAVIGNMILETGMLSVILIGIVLLAFTLSYRGNAITKSI